MSQSETIVRAAALLTLSADNVRVFTSAELAVAAWKLDRCQFGLAGFTDEHPDHHRVFAALCGERGLVGRGFLAKAGRGLYSLTGKGRRFAAAGSEPVPATQPPAALDRATERELERLLDEDAYTAWLTNMHRELSAADAADFWGGDRDATGRLIAYLQDLGEVQTARGRVVGRHELGALWHCHSWLYATFAKAAGRAK